MPVSKKKSIRKAASAAKKAAPQHKQRRRKIGVTSATAKQSTKKYGHPQQRLEARREWEEKQELTPLQPDDKLLRLKDAAARLGISAWTLRDWALKKDKVVYRRIGGVLLMIPESEVVRLSSHGN